MPAHIKASLVGCSLTVPIRDGGYAWARGKGYVSASIAATAEEGGWC